MEHAHAHSSTATVKDPVCGMDVDPSATKHQHTLGDDDYYFCSKGCLEKFKADPDKYTKAAKSPGGCCHHDHG